MERRLGNGRAFSPYERRNRRFHRFRRLALEYFLRVRPLYSGCLGLITEHAFQTQLDLEGLLRHRLEVTGQARCQSAAQVFNLLHKSSICEICEICGSSSSLR